MKRRHAREYALQILFQLDITNGEFNDIIFKDFWENVKEDDEVKEFTYDIVIGTKENTSRIDEVIKEAALNWAIDRMAIVDRNILRAATYELLYRIDIPSSVIINEAIEIAKRYSTEESASFINGILDKIQKTVADESRHLR